VGVDGCEELGVLRHGLRLRAGVADTVNTMPEKTLPAFADHGELHPGGDAVTGTAP